MKTTIFLLLGFTFSLNGHASECLEAYVRKWQKWDSYRKPMRSVFINSGTTGALSQSTLLALGLSSPVGLITGTSTALATGGLYFLTGFRHKSLQKVLSLYEQALAGQGPQLVKTHKKTRSKLSLSEFAKRVTERMENGEFCKKKRGKLKVLSYRKVMKKL